MNKLNNQGVKSFKVTCPIVFPKIKKMKTSNFKKDLSKRLLKQIKKKIFLILVATMILYKQPFHSQII